MTHLHQLPGVEKLEESSDTTRCDDKDMREEHKSIESRSKCSFCFCKIQVFVWFLFKRELDIDTDGLSLEA